MSVSRELNIKLSYAVHIEPTAGAFQDSVVTDVEVVAQGETDLGTIVLDAL